MSDDKTKKQTNKNQKKSHQYSVFPTAHSLTLPHAGETWPRRVVCGMLPGERTGRELEEECIFGTGRVKNKRDTQTMGHPAVLEGSVSSSPIRPRSVHCQMYPNPPETQERCGGRREFIKRFWQHTKHFGEKENRPKKQQTSYNLQPQWNSHRNPLWSLNLTGTQFLFLISNFNTLVGSNLQIILYQTLVQVSFYSAQRTQSMTET